MALVFMILCLAFLTTLSRGETRPKIYTKNGNVHIQSGENGNIVFEPSEQGNVMVGSQVLNVTGNIGPKGDPGAKGDVGEKGSVSTKGESGQNGTKGEQGDKGGFGDKGDLGRQGTKGELGDKGDPGPQGLKGSIGNKGDLGIIGPPGSKGDNGTQGLPGPQGLKGDNGDTHYYVNPNTKKALCNTSNFGIMRYFSERLQLCTPKGWKNIAFENNPSQCLLNVPKLNLDAFYSAKTGILFQFNNDSSAIVNNQGTFNISTETLPLNSTLSYHDSVMRKAVHFGGKSYMNLSGIPDNFWKTSNWSVMALMKFGKPTTSSSSEIAVLGHGTPDRYKGFHLGVTDQHPIQGYYSNDLHYTDITLDMNKWYHITWTSQKSKNSEKRCIIVNGDAAMTKCDVTKPSYVGSGDTTIGSWWHRPGNDLTLDQLTIISDVVQYRDQQLCLAKLIDQNLP